MTSQERIFVTTKVHGEMHDLTDDILKIIAGSKIARGTVNISVIGSTAAIGTIEFEPGLERDLPELLDRMIPPSRSYGHEQAWHDGNGHSHLQATLLGPSLTLPVTDGKMVVGTWQQVFLIELDIKPREREVVVTTYGE